MSQASNVARFNALADQARARARTMADEAQARVDRAGRDRARLRLLYPIVVAAYGTLVDTAAAQQLAQTLASKARLIEKDAEGTGLADAASFAAGAVENGQRSPEGLSAALNRMNAADEGLALISEPVAQESLTIFQRLAMGGAATGIIATGSTFAGATGVNADAIREAAKTASGKDAKLVKDGLARGETIATVFKIGVPVLVVGGLAFLAWWYLGDLA